jgi:acyl-CoA synthetase (AMP-forming)/AMP-acid ligase II
VLPYWGTNPNMLQGLNMDRELLVSGLISYAGRNHAATDVVSMDSAGVERRSNWGEIAQRAGQVGAALLAAGVVQGDRVATIASNDHRHLEVYYGITGIGAVLHTVNPRLHEDQLAYIIGHAEDVAVLVDPDFVPIAERIADRCPSVKTWVVLGGDGSAASTSLPDAIDHEAWIAGHPQPCEWPEFSERAAATLCYTSGTTGNPKGILQSHRAIVLQTWATSTGEGHNVNSGESILLAVPMFHVNGWAVPFASAMTGAKLVLPGPDLSAEALVRLINDEEVTMSLGVPTVWLSVVQYLDKHDLDIPTMNRLAVGGSAAPRFMTDILEDKYGVFVSHVWGMTEMTQGSSGRLTHRVTQLGRNEHRARQAKAGRELFGIELRLVDDDGNEVPRDGVSFGEVQARGPWVAGSYFRHDDNSTHEPAEAGGWLKTGDVATLDSEGYITIVDRAKDVIKSGGEWISSIDLENAALAAESVVEAAVVGMPHDRWGERPLLLVALVDGASLDTEAILDAIRPQVASWWLPNDVLAIDEIPHTGTGKIDKKALRAAYADHEWPT